MPEAFVVDALRTPIGRHGGALRSVRPDDLAARVLERLVARNRLDAGALSEVLLGCANQAGEDNRNVARMAALLAGFPETVPAVTVNRLCGSGLEAIVQGARMLRLGEADLVIAGGVESMTRAPWSMPKPAEGFPTGKLDAWDTSLGWRYPNPRLAARFPLEQMGETAENVAERHRITREDQDAYALGSHRKALAARQAGVFERELVTVDSPQRKGPAVPVTEDEGPRADTSLERLAALKPAFREGGTVTAGNGSTLNDGAAAVLLANEAGLARLGGRTPLARIAGSTSVGLDPRVMGLGPVPATERLVERLGWRLADVELVELNEAFAAQALACERLLGLDPARVNVSGGAIALGHPLGMSGARLVGTLAHALVRRGRGRGIATMCIGVGQGMALGIER